MRKLREKRIKNKGVDGLCKKKLNTFDLIFANHFRPPIFWMSPPPVTTLENFSRTCFITHYNIGLLNLIIIPKFTYGDYKVFGGKQLFLVQECWNLAINFKYIILKLSILRLPQKFFPRTFGYINGCDGRNRGLNFSNRFGVFLPVPNFS